MEEEGRREGGMGEGRGGEEGGEGGEEGKEGGKAEEGGREGRRGGKSGSHKPSMTSFPTPSRKSQLQTPDQCHATMIFGEGQQTGAPGGVQHREGVAWLLNLGSRGVLL